jgi:hypothetical protein
VRHTRDRVSATLRQSRRRAVLLGSALVATTLLLPSTAGAVLDPSRAQGDVDSAIREKDFAFCRAPHEPLSFDAVELCPHASAIPNCDGFAAACAKLSMKPPDDGAIRPSPWFFQVLGALAQGLVWVLVAAIVLAVLVPIVRALVRARRDKGLSEPTSKPATTPRKVVAIVEAITDEEVLLQRAEALVREGDYSAAIQLYLAASLRALDKRGSLRIARDRTNGEYVRACNDAGAKPSLREIVREVDRAQFGGQSPTGETAATVRQRAMAIVRALPAVMLAVSIALGALGCSGGGLAGKGKRPAGDPAGDEVLRELLIRQGAHVETLDRSLASLEAPKAGAREAAVLVDVNRTALDDETRENLEQWVKAGGVLVLFGWPPTWPKAFGEPKMTAASGKLTVTVRRLLARSAAGAADDDDEEGSDDDNEGQGGSPVYAEGLEHASVARSEGVNLGGANQRVGWFEGGPEYAAVISLGKGYVLGVASDELMTNAGLARPGNAAAMVAILSNADRLHFRLAQPDDGVSPPTSPIAALTRAGLGSGLVHGLLATLVLFLAVGVRLARPKPSPPPTRRAFAEHVEAVGALYARTRSAPHALAAYARFVDERLRANLPRGANDVPAFLASRAKLPLDACQRVWARAMAAKAGGAPAGDELAVLKELSAVYAAAVARD